RDLLGDAELRELLDAPSIEAIERQLQRLDPKYRAKSADEVHDLLLAIGDLSGDELQARAAGDVAANIDGLVGAGRVVNVQVAGASRFIAVEDSARYRDGIGIRLPAGIPQSLLEPVLDPR